MLPAENNRVKKIQNSKSIKYKYPQPKNYHKVQPKTIISNKKFNSIKDLMLKKIEKTLVDRAGNEYKMIIEKI